MFDGDKLLVTNDPVIINAAERINKKNKVVPLFYDLGKAGAEEINNDSKFRGLTFAFTHGNIGGPSNDITKIWNSGNVTDEEINVVKLLVARVNWTIDCAKTLFNPEPPDNVSELIKNHTKAKVPYFFTYAKDKKESNVESINDSVVNRIRKIYNPISIKYSFKGLGRFDYHVLMADPNRIKNEEAVARYREIVKKLDFNTHGDYTSSKGNISNWQATYQEAKDNIVGHDDKNEVIDSVIIEIFNDKKTYLKKAFWEMFGNEIYLNILRNTSRV